MEELALLMKQMLEKLDTISKQLENVNNRCDAIEANEVLTTKNLLILNESMKSLIATESSLDCYKIKDIYDQLETSNVLIEKTNNNLNDVYNSIDYLNEIYETSNNIEEKLDLINDVDNHLVDIYDKLHMVNFNTDYYLYHLSDLSDIKESTSDILDRLPDNENTNEILNEVNENLVDINDSINDSPLDPMNTEDLVKEISKVTESVKDLNSTHGMTRNIFDSVNSIDNKLDDIIDSLGYIKFTQ